MSNYLILFQIDRSDRVQLGNQLMRLKLRYTSFGGVAVCVLFLYAALLYPPGGYSIFSKKMLKASVTFCLTAHVHVMLGGTRFEILKIAPKSYYLELQLKYSQFIVY